MKRGSNSSALAQHSHMLSWLVLLCGPVLHAEKQAHNDYFKYNSGRAIAEAVSRWLPIAAARVRFWGLVKWDLWRTKWRWSWFSPNTSVSRDNLNSTKFFIIIITRGRLQ
jgi:hypothetical protein